MESLAPRDTAISRFEALIRVYQDYPGISGDILSASPLDALTGIVADAMHYASAKGVEDRDVLFSALLTVELETSEH